MFNYFEGVPPAFWIVAGSCLYLLFATLTGKILKGADKKLADPSKEWQTHP